MTVECAALDRCGNETRQTCTFPVTVIRVNNPPVARSDSANCGCSCCVPVLKNDYDPDGDPIHVVSVSQPQIGSAWVEGDSICYTDTFGPPRTEVLTYTITDGCDYSTGTLILYIVCKP